MVRSLTALFAVLCIAMLAEAQPALKPREVASVPGQTTSLMVSPDGKLVAANTVRIKLAADGSRGGDGDEVVVWDLATGAVRVNTGKSDLGPLGFSANSKELIIGGRAPFDQTHVQTWDVETGKASKPIILMNEAAFPRLSADATTALTVTNRTMAGAHAVDTWDLATGKSLESFKLDSGRTLFYSQAAKGPFQAVVETAPRVVGLLTRDAKTGKTTTVNLPGVANAHISPDGKLVAGLGEQGIKLFDSAGKLKWTTPGNYQDHRLDGKYVIATDAYAKIFLLDLISGKVMRTIESGYQGAPSTALTKDGKSLVVSGPMGKKFDKYVVQVYTLAGK